MFLLQEQKSLAIKESTSKYNIANNLCKTPASVLRSLIFPLLHVVKQKCTIAFSNSEGRNNDLVLLHSSTIYDIVLSFLASTDTRVCHGYAWYYVPYRDSAWAKKQYSMVHQDYQGMADRASLPVPLNGTSTNVRISTTLSISSLPRQISSVWHSRVISIHATSTCWHGAAIRKNFAKSRMTWVLHLLLWSNVFSMNDHEREALSSEIDNLKKEQKDLKFKWGFQPSTFICGKCLSDSNHRSSWKNCSDTG